MIRNKRGWLAVILSVGLAALVLAACGGGGSSSSSESTAEAPTTEEAKSEETTEEASSEEGSSKSSVSSGLPNYAEVSPKNLKPAKDITAAMVIASNENGGEQSIIEGFEAKAKELGVKAETYIGKSLGDNASQVNAMESAIARKPDFIILFPGTPSGLNAQVQQARSQGIKVITDLLPSEQEVDLFINSTIVGQGEAAGEAVTEYLNGKGNAWYLLGGSGTPVPTGFEEGFGTAFKGTGIKVTYKKTFPGVTAAEAVEAAEAAVTSNPEVSVIMTDSGESVEGIQQVLKRSGINNVLFTTTSIFSAQQVKEINEGSLISTSVPFYQSGETGVEWGIALTQGQKPPSPELELEPLLLTKDNIEEAVNSGALFDSVSTNVIKCGGEGQEPCL
jgi:ABC-type sugar transport system substrate-binding protein